MFLFQGQRGLQGPPGPPGRHEEVEGPGLTTTIPGPPVRCYKHRKLGGFTPVAQMFHKKKFCVLTMFRTIEFRLIMRRNSH